MPEASFAIKGPPFHVLARTSIFRSKKTAVYRLGYTKRRFVVCSRDAWVAKA